MTKRGWAVLTACAAFLMSAFSSGSDRMYLAATFAALLLAYACVSVLGCLLSIRVTGYPEQVKLMRGEWARLYTGLKCNFPLPVGTAELSWCLVGEKGKQTVSLRIFREQTLVSEVLARHTGAFPSGPESLAVTDLFGLIRLEKKLDQRQAVLSLPRTFSMEESVLLSGEEGNTSLRRGREDPTSPEGVRDYHPGDPLKRVHWKLSQRRQALLVRTYEMMSPPEMLILTDQTFLEGDPERSALFRDAILETAASLAKERLSMASPVRLPLYEAQGEGFQGSAPGETEVMLEMLADAPYLRDADYAAFILSETRRLNSVGAVALVTARLTPSVAEAAAAVRRAGPGTILYLVTDREEDETLLSIVNRLQSSLVEVCYVAPA